MAMYDASIKPPKPTGCLADIGYIDRDGYICNSDGTRWTIRRATKGTKEPQS